MPEGALMQYAALAFLLLLIVAPAEAQSPDAVLKSAQDAGVAIVAFIAFPLGARYLYLLVKSVLDDKKADRASSREFLREMSERYGVLSDKIKEATIADAASADTVASAMGTLGVAVTQGKTSADTLAGDVRKLLTRIEPAMAAMEAIEKDIRRRDLKDAQQDAETSKLARVLEGFTAEFGKLKIQVEKGQHDHDDTKPVPAAAGTAAAAADDGARLNGTGAGAAAGGAGDEHGIKHDGDTA